MIPRLLPLVLALSTSALAFPLTTGDGVKVEVPGSRVVNGRAYLPCDWLQDHRPDFTCRSLGVRAFLDEVSLSSLGWNISRSGAASPAGPLAVRRVPPLLSEGDGLLIPASALRILYGAAAQWQGGTLTVPLLPRYRALTRVIERGGLGEARRAVTRLKERTLLAGDFQHGGQGTGPVVTLYPEGEVRRFFVWRGRTLSAYEVRDGFQLRVWQAAVDLPPASLWTGGRAAEAGTGDSLERLAGPFARTQGQRSAVTGRLVYWAWRASSVEPTGEPLGEEVRTGWIELGGTVRPVGSGSGTRAVQLPGETRHD